MNLSLVSQKPSSPTTLGVLAALRAASEESDYVTEVRVAQPQQWQPSKDEAAILLLEEEGLPGLFRSGQQEAVHWDCRCFPCWCIDSMNILHRGRMSGIRIFISFPTVFCWMRPNWRILPAAWCCKASLNPISRCFPVLSCCASANQGY